jgi:hypothetical protein
LKAGHEVPHGTLHQVEEGDRQIGIDVLPMLLALADEVIE